jgi:hypothetical protein
MLTIRICSVTEDVSHGAYDSRMDGPQFTARRYHWLEAELHCLQCGRPIGRLVEAVSGTHTSSQFSAHAAFCPAELDEPFRQYRPSERVVCSSCGGTAVIANVERLTTYVEPPLDAEEQGPRRGRPPKLPRNYIDRRHMELEDF